MLQKLRPIGVLLGGIDGPGRLNHQVKAIYFSTKTTKKETYAQAESAVWSFHPKSCQGRPSGTAGRSAQLAGWLVDQ